MLNRSSPLPLGRTLPRALIAFLGVLIFSPGVSAQDNGGYFTLDPNVHVYDETGTSLSAEQTAALELQIAELADVDADVVVYVRALDASTDETLDQVEAFQQSWVAATGADQANAAAILINRNPNDPNDARAGIFVGSRFDDGNVPRGEQEAIVEDRLIPPLRNGDVYGSLSGALSRLESSIINGPPQSSFERWAKSAASSWLPWVGSASAATLFGISLVLFRSRQNTNLPAPTPTLQRPDNLNPVLAVALVTGSAPAAAFPAMLLRLAAREALVMEPEKQGGVFSKPTIQVRLADEDAIADDFDQATWSSLQRKSVAGVIPSKELQKLAGADDLKHLATAHLRQNGWLNPAAGRARWALFILSFVGVVLAVGAAIIAGVAGNWWAMVAPVALAVAAIWAIVAYSMYSNLSRQGQAMAQPWIGYRKGLERAAKDMSIEMDLDQVLPDSVAMNLGPAIGGRVKQATEAGVPLRAFSDSSVVMFAWWPAFCGVFASTSASTTSTVSGGGAGGGGGAAGST